MSNVQKKIPEGYRLIFRMSKRTADGKIIRARKGHPFPMIVPIDFEH